MWSPCNKSNKQPAIGYSSCGPAILKMAYFSLLSGKASPPCREISALICNISDVSKVLS